MALSEELCEIDLLIGAKAFEVVEPLELGNTSGGGGAANAVRSKPGWVLNGPLAGGRKSSGQTGCLCCNSQPNLHHKDFYHVLQICVLSAQTLDKLPTLLRGQSQPDVPHADVI